MVRYGIGAVSTFSVFSQVRYGIDVIGNFSVLDKEAPIVSGAYCLDENKRVLTSLSKSIRVGANIYDAHTSLEQVVLRWGLNDPATPNSYVFLTPSAGEIYHIWDGTIGLVAGQVVYYRIIARDPFGNTNDTGLLSVVVEGIPVRYGIDIIGIFVVKEEVREVIGYGVIPIYSPFPESYIGLEG